MVNILVHACVMSHVLNAHRVVRMLLDEVVSSTVQRCIDPALMEPKVIITMQLAAYGVTFLSFR